MDPLSVLRDFTKDNLLEQVQIDGDRIKFGDKYNFPKKIPTGFRRDGSKTAPAGGSGAATYDLETLVYFMKEHQNSIWILYVKAAREQGLSQLVFTDKKPLLDYLYGKIDKSDKIQQTAPEFVLPTSERGDELEPSAKRAKLDDSSTLGEVHGSGIEIAPLVSKERILRDRNSQLSLPGKNFKAVLDILGILNREEEAAKHRARAKAQHQKYAKAHQPPASARPPPPPPLTDPGAPPPPPSVAPPPETVRAAEKERARQQASRSHGGSSGRSSSGKKQAAEKKPRPIIIVPAAASSKITMLNVKAFLEQGVYKSNEALRKEGAVKQTHSIILRKIGRPKPVPYEVTEKPPPPKSEDWSRVVAVFVTGATWQFKEWPRGSDPGQMAATFHDVLGIHVGLKNEPLSDTVKSWNIQRYALHPNDRHGDQPIVMEIFKALDKFLSERRRYGHLTY